MKSPVLAGYDPNITAEPGDYYDAATADRYARFFPNHLVLTEGEWAGKPFALKAWQDAFIRIMFGWKRKDGSRRYRKCLLFVPRKNSKTTTAAGIVCAVMHLDREPAAQMYSLATDTEQAALVFTPTAFMMESNPKMNAKVRVYTTYKSIKHHDDRSTYRVLSGKIDGKHGKNPHLVIVDELHEFKERHRSILEAMESAQGSRRQPLTILMTTAGHAGPSLVNEEYAYACGVRDLTIDDHAYLPVIFEAPKDADWKDPAVWAAANPTYPESPKHDFLVAECRKAQDRPSYENTFRRLYLNQQTDQETRWLSMTAWKECPKPDEFDMVGPCYAGVDLASTTDMAAAAYYWPRTNTVHVRYWLPEGALRGSNREHYKAWKRSGLLETTPGDVIDYDHIEAAIIEDCEKYGVVKLGADPYNARQLVIRLNETHGIDAVEYRQGFLSMNEPSKAIEILVIQRALKHDNEILTWNAQNAAVLTDPAENIKPVKSSKNADGKIDGLVALIIAKGISMFEPDGTSIYETQGIATG